MFRENPFRRRFPKAGQAILLLLDVNDTFLRTGPLVKHLCTADIHGQYAFRDLVETLSSFHAVNIVFVTGNTYEYVRRVEEPLCLSRFSNVSVGVISEGGLVARLPAFPEMSWQLKLTDETRKSLDGVPKTIREFVTEPVYYQANEIKVTAKPSAGRFSEGGCEVTKLSESLGDTVQVYGGHDYIDVYPRSFVNESGAEEAFVIKGWATRSVLKERAPGFPVAIGDSREDGKMLDAAYERGGLGFWVGNARPTSRVHPRTAAEYVDGVNEVLKLLLETVSTGSKPNE